MSAIANIWNKLFHSKRIGFLGLKDAGKTQLLQTLGCKEAHPGRESHGEKYESFVIELPSKNVFIKCGVDYGGGLSVFLSRFRKLIRDGHYVMFVIDVNEFINNNSLDEEGNLYRESVLARLDMINANVTNVEKDKVYIILTHADQWPGFTPRQLIDEFSKFTADKPYSVLTKNCFALDARDREQVRNHFNTIFS